MLPKFDHMLDFCNTRFFDGRSSGPNGKASSRVEVITIGRDNTRSQVAVWELGVGQAKENSEQTVLSEGKGQGVASKLAPFHLDAPHYTVAYSWSGRSFCLL